jgi:alpha-mannosidase
VEDPSDTWSHGVVGYSDAEQGCALQEVKVLELGPVRSRLRLSYRWGESLIWLDAVLYEELEQIDIALHADWRQRHELLKLVLPLAVESPRIRVGLPYGATEREADGREEVMAHWLDLFDDVSGAGVVCSSDSGYGYDALGSRLRLTVLRSPRYADHGAPWTGVDPIDWPATGQGQHNVSYRLRAHNERASGGVGLRLSAEHITRLPIVSETWHRGALGASGSAMAVEPSNVVASVLKRAEDGSGWVVRLSEVAGEPTEARISIDRLGRSWEGDLRAYEVTTLLVPDDPAAHVREVAISELELG